MSTPTSPPPSTRPNRRAGAQPTRLVTLALGVRFLTELLLMAAAAWAGAARTRNVGLGIALGVVAAVVVAAVWGLWIAPASRRRLRDPARLVVELVLFGAAAAGLAWAGRTVVGAVMGLVGAVTAVFVRFLPEQARPDQARADQPRADQPRADQPRADQPRADQPHTDQPRADQPHTETPPPHPEPAMRRPRGRDRARPRG